MNWLRVPVVFVLVVTYLFVSASVPANTAADVPQRMSPEMINSPTDNITETIVVPFSKGARGVSTKNSYEGTVTVTISGVGKAADTQTSDAFYIFVDRQGVPMTPVYPTSFYNWTLWINDGPAERTIDSIPAYRPDHIYTFEVEADGEQLHFAVGDIGILDNSGEYVIVVEAEQVSPPETQTMPSLFAGLPPTIDGDLSDWPQISGVNLNERTAKTIKKVIPSEADASAYIRSVWTPNALYFAMQITDNRLVSDSGQIWLDDAVEIGLDVEHDHLPGGEGDYQFTVSVDGRQTEGGVPTSTFQSAVKRHIDGWDVEIAIPASLLDGPLALNDIMGLNFGLIDDDNELSNDSHLIWEDEVTWEPRPSWGQIMLVAETVPPTTPEPPLPPTPAGTTITLQQGQLGYAGTRDSFISFWEPNANYGAEPRLWIRNGGLESALIQFDVSSIPTNARLKTATLSLYTTDQTNPQSFFAVVYQLLRNWTDMEATWNRASLQEAWTLPGAEGVGDRTFTPTSTQGMDRLNGWISFEITPLVQMWVDDPASNQGLIVRGSEGGRVAYEAVSTNIDDPLLFPYRPELIITYWEGTATPTHTPTHTPTPTPTPSPSLTPTPTRTPTPTPTTVCRDAFEPDDGWQRAKLILVDNSPQSHNFHQAADLDYVKFVAAAGDTLTLYTSDLGADVDTTLSLFDTDGTTLLAYNDDDLQVPPASRIDWTIMTTGTYFLMARNFDALVGDCDMTYGLSVERITPTPTPSPIPQKTIFLPAILH